MEHGGAINHNAFAIAPIIKYAQRDIKGGFFIIHTRFIARARLLAHGQQIMPHFLNPGFGGDGAVAGNNRLDIHGNNAVTGIYPILHGAFPNNRMPANE